MPIPITNPFTMGLFTMPLPNIAINLSTKMALLFTLLDILLMEVTPLPILVLPPFTMLVSMVTMLPTMLSTMLLTTKLFITRLFITKLFITKLFTMLSLLPKPMNLLKM